MKKIKPSIRFYKRRERIASLEKRSRTTLTLLFSALVFANLLITIALMTMAFDIVIRNGRVDIVDGLFDEQNMLALIAVISIILGWSLSLLLSRFAIRPFNKVVTAMNRLAEGDFDARISFSKPLSKIPVVNEVALSFNKMAEELHDTELLRADFVNNFSHEFKTPIVSIAGFAKLLRHGDLTEEEREQYLSAIEEESIRLSGMATNVLKLTRIENQNILADKQEFNVSEQIRKSVLLLEDKWSKKKIELDVEFGEYNIVANEELLCEVWINLFDNAVKFTEDGGKISISIIEEGELYCFTFSNTGQTIPKDKIDKIWNKFYQADESHSTSGNGVGLAIVKKIVALHDGDVSVSSENGVTEFVVILPKG